MRDNSSVVRVPAVVEVRAVEVSVDQRRRFERAARTDIVLLMVDEQAMRRMADRATQARVVGEGSAE
jgi:hypothetical protein